MRQLWLVYRFHVTDMVKQKSFMISAALFAAVILIGAFFSHQSNQNAEPDIIWISQQIDGITLDEKTLNDTFEESGYDIQLVDKGKKELQQLVLEKEIASAFHLSGEAKDPKMEHLYRYSEARDIAFYMEQAIRTQVTEKRLTEANVSADLLTGIDDSIAFTYEQVHDTGKSYGLIYPLVFLMYVFVMGFGQSIAMNVVSEKSTKVIEMLLPKIKPLHSFYAKIFSSFTIGLMQFAVVALSFFLVIQLGWVDGGNMSLFGFEILLSDLTFGTMAWFVFFFFIMFFIYGLLYAALGSKVSRIEDLGPVITPIIVLVVAAFGLGIYTIFSPESMLSVASSYIPFFSPIVLFVRIVMGVAATTEIIVSLALFFGTTVLLTKLSEKWFAQGISHYGKIKKEKKSKK